MNENQQYEMAQALAREAKNALEDKKGLDVKVLEVGKQTVLADFFVIATGTSNTHVKALADEAEFKIKENLSVTPGHVEGFKDNMWTLLDYGSVVIHVFTKDGREFYNLDKLWQDSGAALPSQDKAEEEFEQ